MVLHGHGFAGQSGRRAHLPSATFILYDSSDPYSIALAPADGASAVRGLIVNSPRTLLPLPSGTIKQLTAVTMPAATSPVMPARSARARTAAPRTGVITVVRGRYAFGAVRESLKRQGQLAIMRLCGLRFLSGPGRAARWLLARRATVRRRPMTTAGRL